MENTETDSRQKYKMPAEWKKHDATWLSWPKDPTTFPQEILKDVESVYIQMIEALEKGEIVNILVNDEVTQRRISSSLRNSSNVVYHRIKSVDVWVRDYGPIFVQNHEAVATKWIFNSWGNKYDDLMADNEAGFGIARSAGLKIIEPGIVLEGGSIDVNGEGTLITSRQCLLNKNRNPHLSKNEISDFLGTYLGAENIIWLESGISGDDTDGHVDDLARFVNSETIVCMVEEDHSDEDYDKLQENYAILKEARSPRNRNFVVVPILMPKKKVEYKEGRLPASYANFYIGNSAVLVPIFNDQNDVKALQTIQRYFPLRKVLGINCRALVFGLGSIHCVTQQQPIFH